MKDEKSHLKDLSLLRLNLKTLLFLSFVFACLFFIVYYFVLKSISNSILTFVSAIICIVLYWIARNERHTKRVKTVFIVYLNFVLLPLAWITTYGSKGPMVYYSIVFIVLSSLLVTNKAGKFVPVLVVFEIFLLWSLESHYFNIIKWLSSSYKIQENILPHYLFACVILTYCLFLHHRNSDVINKKLTNYSTRDALTNLYNRRYLMNSLQEIHSEYFNKTQTYVFVMMDIDNLKQANDLYGHLKGDEILQMLGGIINTTLRKSDIGVRYGGDEFALILYDADLEDVKKAISRINEAFTDYVEIYTEVKLGLSFGYSKSESDSYEEMIRQADSKMYENKHRKKLD